MKAAPVVLALGSNLADRRAQLARARAKLQEDGVVNIVKESPVVETPPLGPPQPHYLNQVLLGESEYPPLELLAATQRIERELGRTPAPRWHARSIDIDLLDYDHRCFRFPQLTLPHPGIARREFVLLPWSFIDADFVVPGLGESVAELLAALSGSGH